MFYKWVKIDRSKSNTYHAVDGHRFWDDIYSDSELYSACGKQIDSCYDDHSPDKKKCKACLNEIRKQENIIKKCIKQVK